MNLIGFTKTKLPYGWMGNMASYPIEFEGKTWRTTEALFQAMRFTDETIREGIRNEKSPMGAKFKAKGQADKMTIKQLSIEDVANMVTCVVLKLEQHPELQTLLLETGDAEIFEDVTSRGDRGSNKFWGAMLIEGKLDGENILGKIWIEQRENLKLNK